jgi:hypothetical protein
MQEEVYEFSAVLNKVNGVNNTDQQRFCPMRKNVSDVFLDTEFKYVSKISLSPTPFAPG